jgi:gliding motility-associated-like protein
MMRPIHVKFLFLTICIALNFCAIAQNKKCDGSLGDPVIHQDFGAGTNPGPFLTTGTTLKYTSNNCPEDGYYTIANSLTGSGNCHPDTWHDVPADHTGNPNGYMMIINASVDPSLFFVQQAPVLCPNTTYKFSAYALNLIIATADSAQFTEPNIAFSIETTTGRVLAADTTGNIPNSPRGSLLWKECYVYFTTPADVSNVVVKMTNLAPGGNGNDLILDDITFRACGPVIQTGFGSTAGTKKQSLCQGDNAAYTIKAKVLGDNGVSYQWQTNKHNTGWVDISTPEGRVPDSLQVAFVNADTGSYKYRLGVSNGSDISVVGCRVYSPPLAIYVNPLPVLAPMPPQTVCESYTLKLEATGGATYTWTGPNLPPISKNPLVIDNVTPANAGTYTVVAVSDSGCTAALVQTTVTVIPKVIPLVSADAMICAGETTQLNASGGLFYKWTPSTRLDNDAISNPFARPLQTTTYTAHIGNGGCTDSSLSVTVRVNQLPVANAGASQKIFEGQTTTLNGTIKGDNITSLYWTPGDFLDNPLSLMPSASPTDNITYTLTAVSQTCGISTSSVFIRVYKKITIPSAFSPNNDGINDIWNIKELFTYPECSVSVFDRYGRRVYQSTGYTKPWDGILNGSPLPQGTYYYIIDLKNDTPKRSGWVLIVR